jgi:molybdopterin converting factor subunit 1
MNGVSPSEIDSVRVLAFAAVRDLIGVAEAQLELGPAQTVEQTWMALLHRWPALEPYRSAIRIAVNGSYADLGDPVRPGDELALIPPVAGG